MGRGVHSRIIVYGHLASPLSITSLINMYCKCYSVAEGMSVFYESTHLHNVYIYNSMIAGFTLNGLLDEALEFYFKMQLAGIVPDKFTFPCVIKACFDVHDLKRIRGAIFKLGLDFDMHICSSLVHCYLKLEAIDDALVVFEELPEKDDIVLWNAMINGCVQIGKISMALTMFRRLTDMHLIPNNFTVTGVLSAVALAGELYNGKLLHAFAVKLGYHSMTAVSNVLIDMYGKCGQLADAMVIFESIIEKDIYSWNSIICVHEQCGDYDGTLRLLKGMLASGFEPDSVTITAAVPACASLSALMQGREIHGYMIRKVFDKADQTSLLNSIMDMYTKCGRMKEAQCIFDNMRIRDAASWNILIMGYGMLGHGDKALDLFSQMCDTGLKPDEISFVGILSACSHAGFVSQGQELLAAMLPRYGVSPLVEHYACVVDMLGRAGQLEEAYKVISSMAVKPNEVVWRAFLNACTIHGNSDLAEIAANNVLQLEPEHCGNYVLVSNVYGASGRYKEVRELRYTMKQQDVKKLPGRSWVEQSNLAGYVLV